MKINLIYSLLTASLVFIINTSVNAEEADSSCIPQNATIESATMSVSLVGMSGVDSNVASVYRITAPWEETSVDWASFNNAYDDTYVYGTISNNVADVPTTKTVDLTGLVQNWLDGLYPNYGVLLGADAVFSGTSIALYANSESIDVATRPKLDVCYNDGVGNDCVTIQRPGLDKEIVNDTVVWGALPTTPGDFLDQLWVGYRNGFAKPSLLRFNVSSCPVYNPGTGTPGYWKNHPEAWPVGEITVGGVTLSAEEAVIMLMLPEKGDKTYTVFRGLVAATLNVFLGNDDSCISSSLDAANAWLATNTLGSGVKGRSSAWKEIEGDYLKLDQYNNGVLYDNGQLCAPARD